MAGDEKTAVFVYEVFPGEGKVSFTCIVNEGYNLKGGPQHGFLGQC